MGYGGTTPHQGGGGGGGGRGGGGGGRSQPSIQPKRTVAARIATAILTDLSPVIVRKFLTFHDGVLVRESGGRQSEQYLAIFSNVACTH